MEGLKMNKLSEAIEQTKNECLENGEGKVKLNDNIVIYSEWVRYDNDEEIFDTILITIFENNIHKFSYYLHDEIKVIVE